MRTSNYRDTVSDKRNFPFILSLSMTLQSHSKPEFAGTSHDSCHTQGLYKSNTISHPVDSV
jgi:hypothetical protein